jgi:hypothetical protein
VDGDLAEVSMYHPTEYGIAERGSMRLRHNEKIQLLTQMDAFDIGDVYERSKLHLPGGGVCAHSIHAPHLHVFILSGLLTLPFVS